MSNNQDLNLGGERQEPVLGSPFVEPRFEAPATNELELPGSKLGAKDKTSIVNLLFVALMLNLIISGYLFYRLHSLSYRDIDGAPNIQYLSREALIDKAATYGPDGEKYLKHFIDVIKNKNIILLDSSAIVATDSNHRMQLPTKESVEKAFEENR